MVAIACGKEEMICSGLVILSQYLVTDLKESLTDMVGELKFSTCCKTGSGLRLSKTSPDNIKTGNLFECATAAAVTMFVAPGPMELVAIINCLRFLVLA